VTKKIKQKLIHCEAKSPLIEINYPGTVQGKSSNRTHIPYYTYRYFELFSSLSGTISAAEPESQHFGGARAVTRCGSGSGSGSGF
jgi:hypothetical protein